MHTAATTLHGHSTHTIRTRHARYTHATRTLRAHTAHNNARTPLRHGRSRLAGGYTELKELADGVEGLGLALSRERLPFDPPDLATLLAALPSRCEQRSVSSVVCTALCVRRCVCSGV